MIYLVLFFTDSINFTINSSIVVKVVWKLWQKQVNWKWLLKIKSYNLSRNSFILTFFQILGIVKWIWGLKDFLKFALTLFPSEYTFLSRESECFCMEIHHVNIVFPLTFPVLNSEPLCSNKILIKYHWFLSYWV